jgi:hypothetical protein
MCITGGTYVPRSPEARSPVDAKSRIRNNNDISDTAQREISSCERMPMSADTCGAAQMEAFVEMLRHLCMRPKMYTLTGTYREVISYVEGYLRGTNFPRGQTNLESGMQPFGRWLARRYGSDQNRHWSQVLVEHCGKDEQQALQQLCQYFEEYLTVGQQQ